MSRLQSIVLMAAVCCAAWWLIHLACGESTSSSGGTPLPLSAASQPSRSGGEQLLLLDDDEPTTRPSSGGTPLPLADNGRCHVCHLNFAKEELSLRHAQANVGCAKCHGVSDAHIADESWASGGNGTAPDIMYPREKINAGCMKCHAAIDALKHKAFLAGTSEQKLCTECHGKHHMASRKCKWK